MSIEKKMITLQNKIDRMIKMKETTIAKNYKKLLDELRITLARIYEEYELEGQLAWKQMSKYNRLQKLDKEVYTMITELYKENSKVIKGTLTGIVTTTYTNTFNIINDATRGKLKAISKELDVAKTVNMEMSGLHWGERVGKHRADIIYSVKKEIRQGLAQGDTYSNMAKRLKKELEVDTYKVNRIIRTESNRCFNQAKLDSLDSLSRQGVKMMKKYLSARDERTRSQHSALHEVTIPLEEEFVYPDGVTTMSPSLSGYAHHDCNCRCLCVPIIVTD